jgi:YbbR domain-containing protein
VSDSKDKDKDNKGGAGGAPTTNPPKRKAPDTIGSLGRAPARTGRIGPHIPLPPAPPEPAPDRGARIKYHLREAFLGNLGLKFLSLVLALTVFLLVNTDRDHDITARVGVSYLLPKDRVMVSPQLAEVKVGLRGPYRRLRRFDDRRIDRIEIDVREGRDAEIAITPDMVDVPSGLIVTSISPASLRVAFEKRVARDVAVTPVIAGRPKHGYIVGEVKVEPAMVQASGGENDILKLTDLRTREVRVDGKEASFKVETKLVPPENVAVELTGLVEVAIEIKEALETRRLGRLAVRVIGEGIDPIGVITDPPAIEVVLTGTVLAVDDAVKKGIVPTIKVTASDVAAKRSATVVVDGVPAGVGVELVPAKIEVSPVVQPKPQPKPKP